jgi:hypothetical protein
LSDYTTDIFVSDVRSAAMLPTTSTATFTDADLLRFADREMQSKMIPLVMALQEAFWDFDATAALVQDSGAWSVGYRIPSRAIGGKLRQVVLLDENGTQHGVVRLSNDDVTARVPGFLVQGNLVYFYNPWGNWNGLTVQMTYPLRPGTLVLPAAAGLITSINSAVEVSVSSVPVTFNGSATYDLIRGQPGFECQDVARAASITSTEMTFSSLPNGLEAGDWIALGGQSPVPQIPVELHPLLVQRTVVKVLEAIGDREGMGAAQAKAQEIESDARTVLSPRVDGEAKCVTNRNSPFRRRGFSARAF